MTENEIAQTLGISAKTVSAHLTAVRKKLREQLEGGA
jgi:DNA-binding CsgD family transcriptional regulator